MMVKGEKSDQFVFLKMELSIKESGSLMTTKKTGEACKSGQMVQDMMASGKTEWQMDTEGLFTLRVTYTKESGMKTRLMDMEFILISMEVGTRANGSKTNSMELVLSNGQTELSMKVNMSQG